MEVVYTKQGTYLVNKDDYEDVARKIEKAGRICYGSKQTDDFENTEKFIRSIIKRGHESVLEHHSFTFFVQTDRAIANELVRHRLASYSQRSSRYKKFDEYVPVIVPKDILESDIPYVMLPYERAIHTAVECYEELLDKGVAPEIARSVLPLSTVTILYVTMNIRELRHFFKLRLAKAAHPEMRELAAMMFLAVKYKYPVFFEDMELVDYFDSYTTDGKRIWDVKEYD